MNLTGNRCRCAACNRYFNSVSAFDKHRSGPAEARVCLDPAGLGMVKNAAGFWVTERMPLKGEPRWAVSRPGDGKTGDFGRIPTRSAPEPETA